MAGSLASDLDALAVSMVSSGVNIVLVEPGKGILLTRWRALHLPGVVVHPWPPSERQLIARRSLYNENCVAGMIAV